MLLHTITMNCLLLIIIGITPSTLSQFVEFKTNYNENTNHQIDYSFRYYIDNPASGVSLDHWEGRVGSHVEGGYGLLEPDGLVRSVHYEVNDDSGFRTVVKTRTPGSVQYQNIYSSRRSTQPRQPYRHAEPIKFS